MWITSRTPVGVSSDEEDGLVEGADSLGGGDRLEGADSLGGGDRLGGGDSLDITFFTPWRSCGRPEKWIWHVV